MKRAIKYRIYPTPEQEVLIKKTFGCCRKIYNLMLADRIKNHEAVGKFISGTPASYKEEYPFLREVDSLALANKQLDLQEAFNNHFDKTRKKRTGFPKFKSAKHSKKSYTTNNQNGTVAVLNNAVKLPKLGLVKAVIHRQPSDDWTLKSATVSQTGDGKFYVSVLFDFENAITPVPVSDNIIGLDYASDGLYVDDKGNKGTNHKYFRESQKKLAKEQRRLSRKVGSKKGEEKSNNYLKQQRKVDKVYRHTANQRLDNLHKISTEIANRYDVVCVESIDMPSISRKYNLGKATFDNGYGMFLNMLEYKLSERGKYFVKVDKWFPSSQMCHACGTIHPEMKDLSRRTLICGCGLKMGRDQNAAINIKNEGLRLLTTEA